MGGRRGPLGSHGAVGGVPWGVGSDGAGVICGSFHPSRCLRRRRCRAATSTQVKSSQVKETLLNWCRQREGKREDERVASVLWRVVGSNGGWGPPWVGEERQCEARRGEARRD